jgi:hypothetical protein
MHDWHAIGLSMFVFFGVLPGMLAAAGDGGLWAIANFGY